MHRGLFVTLKMAMTTIVPPSPCPAVASSFPAYVAAMMDLVKALNKHVTTPNWNKDVATKLDKMVEGVR